MLMLGLSIANIEMIYYVLAGTLLGYVGIRTGLQYWDGRQERSSIFPWTPQRVNYNGLSAMSCRLRLSGYNPSGPGYRCGTPAILNDRIMPTGTQAW